MRPRPPSALVALLPCLLPCLLPWLLAAGCATDLTAEEALAVSSIAGEEELLVGGKSDLGADALSPTRACDAPAAFEARFAAADTDGDGQLTGEEIETASRAADAPSWFRGVRWVYDADEDGVLGAEELDALLADHSARCDALQASLIEAYDADGDGELSEEELAEARAAREAAGSERGAEGHGGRDSDRHGGPPSGVRGGRPGGAGGPPAPVVEAFDTDGDGELSAAERAAAREALRAALRAGERPDWAGGR